MYETTRPAEKPVEKSPPLKVVGCGAQSVAATWSCPIGTCASDGRVSWNVMNDASSATST